jgi:hypothetical protein
MCGANPKIEQKVVLNLVLLYKTQYRNNTFCTTFFFSSCTTFLLSSCAAFFFSFSSTFFVFILLDELVYQHLILFSVKEDVHHI